jgi:hypothetical protein
MRCLEAKAYFVFLLVALLAACSNSPVTPASPLRILYTLAAQPWLADVEACAGERTVLPELSASDFQDLDRFDMAIRIGEDSLLDSSAYQVGSDEIVVILNPENTLSELTAQEVSDLFSGAILDWQEIGGSPAAVQVWVFPPGDDVQRLFVGSTLSGLPVTSLASLATSPEAMITAISEDVNAVGLLALRWMTDGVKAVYSSGEFPVLVFLSDEPGAGMEGVVACMQK